MHKYSEKLLVLVNHTIVGVIVCITFKKGSMTKTLATTELDSSHEHK